MALTATVPACDLVIFGTKGDLARRKLLPSLYQLEKPVIFIRKRGLSGQAVRTGPVRSIRNLLRMRSIPSSTSNWIRCSGNDSVPVCCFVTSM